MTPDTPATDLNCPLCGRPAHDYRCDAYPRHQPRRHQPWYRPSHLTQDNP